MATVSKFWQWIIYTVWKTACHWLSYSPWLHEYRCASFFNLITQLFSHFVCCWLFVFVSSKSRRRNFPTEMPSANLSPAEQKNEKRTKKKTTPTHKYRQANGWHTCLAVQIIVRIELELWFVRWSIEFDDGEWEYLDGTKPHS